MLRASPVKPAFSLEAARGQPAGPHSYSWCLTECLPRILGRVQYCSTQDGLGVLLGVFKAIYGLVSFLFAGCFLFCFCRSSLSLRAWGSPGFWQVGDRKGCFPQEGLSPGCHVAVPSSHSLSVSPMWKRSETSFLAEHPGRYRVAALTLPEKRLDVTVPARP